MVQFRPASQVVETAFGITVDDAAATTGDSLSMQSEGVKRQTWWEKWGFVVIRTVLVLCGWS